MSYSIGELAKKFNIAASTLRYYEKEGLLSQVKRKTSGIREFDEKDCRDLLLIDCLKQNGMSIKEISEFAELMRGGAKTLGERSEILQDQVLASKQHLKALKTNLKRLEYEAWLYQDALDQGTLELAEDVPLTEVPKKLRKARKKIDKMLSKDTEE